MSLKILYLKSKARFSGCQQKLLFHLWVQPSGVMKLLKVLCPTWKKQPKTHHDIYPWKSMFSIVFVYENSNWTPKPRINVSQTRDPPNKLTPLAEKLPEKDTRFTTNVLAGNSDRSFWEQRFLVCLSFMLKEQDSLCGVYPFMHSIPSSFIFLSWLLQPLERNEIITST